MKQKSINQKGFAVVETLLVLVIGAIIGGTGYYVYQSYNKSTDSQNTAQTNANSATPHKKAAKDSTADWTSFTSADGKFSLKYPSTWVLPANKQLCEGNMFGRAIYLGPNSASVLKCATEYFGQMNVISSEGNYLTEGEFDAAVYKDIVSKDVTVDSVKGKRVSGVFQDDPQLLARYDKDTLVVKYSFYTNGTTYFATYVQAPKGSEPSQNVLADFDLMVTKTLKFE